MFKKDNHKKYNSSIEQIVEIVFDLLFGQRHEFTVKLNVAYPPEEEDSENLCCFVETNRFGFLKGICY